MNSPFRWHDRKSLVSQLRQGVCEVKFTKMGGEVRVMRCTLQEGLLPPQTDLEKTIHDHSDPLADNDPIPIVVWDVDKSAWRSFKQNTIIDFKGPDNAS